MGYFPVFTRFSVELRRNKRNVGGVIKGACEGDQGN